MEQQHETVSKQSRIDAGHSTEDTTTFVDDQWIAERIGMKVSTIRSQRFKRRHGLPHWLDLDPVMIGSKPRYRLSSALEWLQGRGQQKPVSE